MNQFSRIEHTKDVVKLTVKDKKILSILVRDARTPLGRIAKRVALSRDGVAYRINRLIKKKVILGFVPFVDYKKLGFFSFRMYLFISEKSEKMKKELKNYLKESKNIFQILEFTDRWDYELGIITQSIDDFNSFKQELDERFSDIILEEQHVIVADRNATSYLPTGFYEQISHLDKPAKFDLTDLAILKSLADNARKPYFTIGKELNIDADTVRNRVKKMLDCGIINRIAAVINISKLNYIFYVFIANMKYINSNDQIKLRNLVANNQNVIEILKTIGNYDLIISIAVESPHTLHIIIKEFKMQFVNTIKNYLTLVTYQEYCFKPIPDVIGDILQINKLITK